MGAVRPPGGGGIEIHSGGNMRRTLIVIAGAVLALALGCGGAGTPERPGTEAEMASAPAGPRAGEAASADGIRIQYTVTGTGVPAIVLIHGWSCDQTFWKDQVAEFSKDHQVVTIDLPGHGESGSGRRQWTLAAFGDDVKRVVEHLGLDHVVLVGHSMGGPIALEAAAGMPERVMMVVGVDTLHDVEEKQDPKEWKALLDKLEADFAGTCREFVGSMFPRDAAPGIVKGVQDSACDGSPEVGKAVMAGFESYDSAAAMARVSAPVRCIQGSMFATNIAGNRKHAHDFDAVVVPGTGHFPQLEKPAEFNRLLRQVLGS
jgi:pimeloyl-ACP methyl ester carboxylesterase